MLKSRLLGVLALAVTTSARPERQQVRLSSEAAANLRGIPALGPFPGHVLLPLNDGTLVPSPAFGVGSEFFQDTTNRTRDAVISALRVGYRHLDNAAVYGNEAAVGEAIKASGIPREQLYITTKYDALNGESVEIEFAKSLKKLGVTYIDLYLIHFPSAANDKTWAAFERLQKLSLVRSIGVSNYMPEDLTALLTTSKVTPAINQIRFHTYNQKRNAPIVEFSKERDITLAAYSSLTSLTKSKGGPVDEVVQGIAESKGLTEAQVLLNWVKSQNILVVTTSGNEVRQGQAFEVFARDFPAMSPEDAEVIKQAGLKGEDEGRLAGN